MPFRIAHIVLRRLAWLAVIAAVLVIGFALLRPTQQDMPWTPLRLGEPIGMFTGRKIAGLTKDRAHCLALLREAGVEVTEVSPHGSDQCRVADAVRLKPGQSILSLSPASVAPSCPVMAGLVDWQINVVQPAAARLFDSKVARIEHYGSYACRRMYGRTSGSWSEHATADAIDVSAFVLADGTRIAVARDWDGGDEKAQFLHEVRDGACRLFSTVLSPDYNAAHQDHLHLDEAERGQSGWRACR